MFEDTNQTETLAEDTNLQEERGLLPFNLFEQDEEETITVKFNGEEKTLTRADARALAQKGMNYDHIYAQREDAHHILDGLAGKEGLSRDEFISRCKGEDLTALRWSRLLDKFPDLAVADIPHSVFLAVGQGENPIEAYQNHLIEELKLQLGHEKSLAENSQKAIGSLKGAGKAESDDFLEGFFGKKY